MELFNTEYFHAAKVFMNTLQMNVCLWVFALCCTWWYCIRNIISGSVERQYGQKLKSLHIPGSSWDTHLLNTFTEYSAYYKTWNQKIKSSVMFCRHCYWQQHFFLCITSASLWVSSRFNLYMRSKLKLYEFEHFSSM